MKIWDLDGGVHVKCYWMNVLYHPVFRVHVLELGDLFDHSSWKTSISRMIKKYLIKNHMHLLTIQRIFLECSNTFHVWDSLFRNLQTMQELFTKFDNDFIFQF